MKKITLVLIAMFGMTMAASAQYTGHKFFDNWSIGVEGGTSTNLCDWDTPNGGVVGINFTKGITPVVSFEFQLQAGIDDDVNWNWSFPYRSNTIHNATFMGNTKINLMNWFGGYKGAPRFFEIQARGGFGYSRFFFPSSIDINTGGKSGNDLNRLVYKFGIDFDFNFGKEKQWTASIRPAMILKGTRDNDPSGAQHTDDTGTGYIRTNCDNHASDSYLHNGVFQITAGLTYHFKNVDGSRHFVAVNEKVVEKVVEKLVDRPVESKPVEKIVEKIVTKNIGGNITIEFGQNKAVLTNTAKAKLNSIEKGTAVALDGYASPEGSKAYNQKLSQRRCDAVKAYLEDRGVKVVDVNAHGAEGLESQRIVYVTVK